MAQVNIHGYIIKKTLEMKNIDCRVAEVITDEEERECSAELRSETKWCHPREF